MYLHCVDQRSRLLSQTACLKTNAQHYEPDAHGHKYMNPLNNARLEPVTPHFNKVRPTDQSNRGCLGLCSHALKRSSDALKIFTKSDLQGPAPSPSRPIGKQFAPFHFSLTGPDWTVGSHAPRLHSSPQTFINLEF